MLKIVELSDGTTLEVKSQVEEWFESSEITNACNDLFVASRIDRLKPVLRYLFIHPAYFRAFEEWGVPLLFVPIISNYGKYSESEISEILNISKEKANIEISKFSQKISPIISEVLINPIVNGLEQLQESEEELDESRIGEIVINKIMPITEGLSIKKIVKKYVSHEIFLQALSLGKIFFDMFSNKIIEEGLNRYRLLGQELSNNDIEVLEQITSAMLDCNIITPVVSIILCMNKYCKHTEVIISDRIPESKCGKCKSDTLLTTFNFINEPYLTLKDKMQDLTAFLYHYIKSKSILKRVSGKQEFDVQCFPNAYVSNSKINVQREIDILVYSRTMKKALAIELKVHQVRSRLPAGRLRNITHNDLKQLIKTMQETGLENGCYMTNLIMSDEEIKNIKEKVLPRVVKDNGKNIEIISLKDETTLFEAIDTLVGSLQSEID